MASKNYLVYFSVGVGTIIAALFGSSPIIIHMESIAGIKSILLKYYWVKLNQQWIFCHAHRRRKHSRLRPGPQPLRTRAQKPRSPSGHRHLPHRDRPDG